MYTLGIETSCDETSCAILKDREVLSNITLSSLKEHKKYGGVVPEIATRAHLKNIDKVLTVALRRAKVSLGKIDLVAVVYKPGLVGALLVGVNFVKALSIAINKPFVGVSHLYAHLFSPFLNNSQRLKFPFLGVVISGGHTEIYRVDNFDKIKILGQTLDDACGEVFDKVAKAYNLGYPGGPVIDSLFKDSYKKEFPFKCGKKEFNLSFSGLKTALIYKKKELEQKRKFNLKTKIKLISSFQYTAIEAIVATILEAKDRLKINRILCGGGVVANQYLRKRLKEEAKKTRLSLYISPKEFSGDNAAMVAGLGFYLYNEKEVKSSIDLKVEAN